MPSSRNHSEEDWESRRHLIRRLIQDEHKSQDYVRKELEKQGFSVSKDQLRYKLDKWTIRRRVRKNMSRAAWEYIHRTMNARGRQDQTLHVIVDGRRLAQEELQNGIRRNVPVVPLYRSHDRPRTPEGMMISVTSPPPIELSFDWPQELPWLQFTARHPQLLSSRPQKATAGTAIDLPSIENLIIPSGLSRCISTSTSVFLPIPELGTIMPESFKDENVRRAQLMISGSTKERAEELVKVLLFQISNNFIRSAYQSPDSAERWYQIFQVLRQSGVTRAPLRISTSSDPTLFAVAERLFAEAFSFAPIVTRRLRSLAMAIVEWLLSSGVSPNVSIDAAFPHRSRRQYSPLEICLLLGERVEKDTQSALTALLKAGANPDLGYYRRPIYLAARLVPGDEKIQVIQALLNYGAQINYTGRVPIEIPLMAAVASGDIPAAELLLINGADVSISFESPKRMYYYHDDHRQTQSYYGTEVVDILACAAAIHPESTALDLVQYFIKTQDQVPSNASVISASWAGNDAVLRLLLSHNGNANAVDKSALSAIGAAAFRGHVETCELLIQFGAMSSFHKMDERLALSPFHLAILGDQSRTAEPFYSSSASDTRQEDLRLIKAFLGYIDEVPARLSGALECCQTPMGAAIMHSKPDKPEPLYRLLYKWGFVLPSWALHFGSETGNVDLVESSLEAKCDLNFISPKGQTAVQALIASLEEKREGVVCLYPTDTGPDLGPQFGPTNDDARHKSRKAQIAYMLVEAGAIPTRELFCLAIETGHRPLFRAVTEHGRVGLSASDLELAIISDCELVRDIWDHIPGAYSPGALCAAVVRADRNGSISSVVRLIQNRQASAPGRPDGLETFAICIASIFENIHLLKLLLETIPVLQSIPHYSFFAGGAERLLHSSDKLRCQLRNIRYPSWYRKPHLTASPLTYAVYSSIALDMLLGAGYLPDWTTLSVAVSLGDRAVIEQLLKQEFSPEHPALPSTSFSEDFPKPIAAAVKTKDRDILELVLSWRGGLVNDNSDEMCFGRSALQLAVEEGDLVAIKVLQKAGSCLNTPAARNGGATALQLASIQGWLGIAKNLIDLGADINAPRAPMYGFTALEGAAANGRLDMVQLLLSSGALITGNGRRQYFTATYLAKRQGKGVIVSLLKNWGHWDQDLEEIDNRLRLNKMICECGSNNWDDEPNHVLDEHQVFPAEEDLPGTITIKSWPEEYVPSLAMRRECKTDKLACGFCDSCSKNPCAQPQPRHSPIDWTLGEELDDDSFWNEIGRVEALRTEEEPIARSATNVVELE